MSFSKVIEKDWFSLSFQGELMLFLRLFFFLLKYLMRSHFDVSEFCVYVRFFFIIFYLVDFLLLDLFIFILILVLSFITLTVHHCCCVLSDKKKYIYQRLFISTENQKTKKNSLMGIRWIRIFD
jgi:hypothetical protein